MRRLIAFSGAVLAAAAVGWIAGRFGHSQASLGPPPPTGSDAATLDRVPDQNTFPVFSPDLKTLQKSMELFAVRWWTVKYDNRTYYFCREDLPFINVSRYDIHGWYQCGADDERLFHIWSARTHGIGQIRVDIDEAGGTVSVVALEREMKGKLVSFFALGAANP